MYRIMQICCDLVFSACWRCLRSAMLCVSSYTCCVLSFLHVHTFAYHKSIRYVSIKNYVKTKTSISVKVRRNTGVKLIPRHF